MSIILSPYNSYKRLIPKVDNVILRLDASKITNVALNSPISIWEDDSSNNHHAYQNTSSIQPTYQINAVTNKPCVNFNGSQWLTIDYTSLLDISPFLSILAVMNVTVLNSNIRVVTSKQSSSSFINRNWWFAQRVNDWEFRMGNMGVGQLTCNDFADLNITLVSINGDGSSLTMFRNGTIQSKSFQYSSIPVQNALTFIGTENGGNRNFIGNIYEIIVYNTFLNSAELNFIHNRLMNKWAIQ